MTFKERGEGEVPGNLSSLHLQAVVGGRAVPGVMKSMSLAGVSACFPMDEIRDFESGKNVQVQIAHPEVSPAVELPGTIRWLVKATDEEGGSPRRISVGIRFSQPWAEIREALRFLIFEERGNLLVVDGKSGLEEVLRQEGEEKWKLTRIDSGDRALQELAINDFSVVVIGERLVEMTGSEFLRKLRAELPSYPGRIISFFREAPEKNETVFYHAPEPGAPEELRRLVDKAMEPSPPRRSSDLEMVSSLRLLELAKKISLQGDRGSASKLTAEAIESLTDSDRGYANFVNEAAGTLWIPGLQLGDEPRVRAAYGITGYVARTGSGLTLEELEKDPRFLRETDDPDGDGEGSFIACPVTSSKGRVLGVLSGVRGDPERPLQQRDRLVLLALAEQLSSVFGQLILQGRIRQTKESQAREAEADGRKIFRERALEQRRRGKGQYGEVLQIPSFGIRLSYWLLICVAGVVLGYGFFAKVTQYAAGPGMVRMANRSIVSAPRSGSVSEVVVAPGQRVSKGCVLVRFFDSPERGELERIESEIERTLSHWLRDPHSSAAKADLGRLYPLRAQAARNLELRTLRASRDGVVRDVRVRPGVAVKEGDIAVTLTPPRVPFFLEAALPGHFRPMIRPGMPLHFRIQGYETTNLRLVVESVAEEVVGPIEAKRSFGAEMSGLLAAEEAVVLIRARIDGDGFRASGEVYRFFEGMRGTVEIPVRSESLLATLIPGLRSVGF